MNSISQTIVVTILSFASASAYAMNSAHTVILELGTAQKDVAPGGTESDKNLTLRVGEQLKVSVINKFDLDVLLPASPEACAVITIERNSDGTWQRVLRTFVATTPAA